MRFVLVIIAVIFIQLLDSSSFTYAKSVDGKIKLRLYKQSSKYFHEVPIEKGYTLFKESEGYNKTLPIFLILHGMAMGADSPFVNGVINAFVERKMQNDYNIFAVDMPELFENSLLNDFYFGVLSNVKPAGTKIGRLLNDVINYGLTIPEYINMVGYSMGAQVAGYSARLVKEVSGKINYIAGLDPAGPGFHTLFGRVSKLTHVSRADARITHFFHTNSISCGTRDRVATADFVFNNGGTQPGCTKDATLDCSHIRVPLLYIEAVANPEKFLARHCASWTHFTSCQCNHHDTASITFPPDERAHGIYYLRTHAKDPFGMGKAGARCRKIIHPVNEDQYHEKIKVGYNPVLLQSKNPLKIKKIDEWPSLQHHRHLKDDLNIHIINGIKKMEDLHTIPADYHNMPKVNEQIQFSIEGQSSGLNKEEDISDESEDKEELNEDEQNENNLQTLEENQLY